MEVTNANFKELLPEIAEAIDEATFLSIDCEFSGLNLVSEVTGYDTPKQYYEKVRKNCREFLVIQYGLSIFRFVPDDDVFKQQTYNFYIFRRPVDRNIPDQRFLCQTSSIDFLITQGFDFNKLFKCGISYLNIDEESKYRDGLEEKQKLRMAQSSPQQKTNDKISIPNEAQPLIDDVMKQIDEFVNNDDVELELPKCNSFIRRLIYQTVGQKYQDKVMLQTKQSKTKDRSFVATKFKTREELEVIEKKRAEEELSQLDDFIGFSKVLKLIVNSNKLIVGHNMCLDFFHTIDKFLTPLSESYAEFKEMAHSLFSKVIDTKFMATSEAFRDLIASTVLKDLLGTVSEKPFQIPAVEVGKEGRGYSLKDEKEHEAGYDAYITGLCFLSMWNYLGTSNDMSAGDTFKDFSLLNPYINRIFLMILRDNQYIHLDGEDPNPSRDHVLHLTFPKTWKLNNIIDLFSPFGNVHVAWINDTSAYVALNKRDQASVALSTLSQSDTYSIMTYHRRQSLLNGTKMAPPPPVPSCGRKRNTSDNASRGGKKSRHDDPKLYRINSEDMEPETVVRIPKAVKKTEVGKKRARKGTSKTFVESQTWD